MVLPLEYAGQSISITNWWGVCSVAVILVMIVVVSICAERFDD